MLHFFLILAALFAFGLGVWQLTAPLDDLWWRHERQMSARGLAPQRSSAWEKSTRLGGWLAMGAGAVLLAATLMTLIPPLKPADDPSRPLPSINERKLTQQEWDACGRDLVKCIQMYGTKTENSTSR